MHHSRRRRAALFALVAVALMAASCGSDGGTSPKDAAAQRDTPAAAKSGGTATYLFLAETADLLPETADFAVGVGTAERFAIYDALVVERAPSGKLEPRLAKRISADDPSHWTVQLRDGVKFSDGTPLDAEAVKRGWERVADPARSSPSFRAAANISRMTVSDAVTLEVELKAPNVLFDREIAEGALNFIGSPTAMAAAGDDFGSKPVGAGAYVLTSWVRNSEMVLERSPSYHGTTHLDRIVVKRLSDETARFSTLESGGGDLAYTPDPAVAARASQGGRRATVVSLDGGLALQFNVTKAPFDDVRARRAVSMAMDVDDLNETVFGGKATPVRNIFRKGSPFASDTTQVAPDTRGAQKLFDELAAEGKPVRFTISASSAQANAGQWLQSRLASFKNVDAKVAVVVPAQLAADVHGGNFQMLMSKARWYDPGLGLTDILVTGGYANFGKYSNPAVDEAAASAVATFDLAARRKAYATIEQAIVDDVPLFFHTRLENILVVGAEIKGMAVVADGIPLWTEMWRA